jgi:hypothetical protein
VTQVVKADRGDARAVAQGQKAVAINRDARERLSCLVGEHQGVRWQWKSVA